MDNLSGTTKFLKNGLSNVVSGGASALLAVVLPYFFVRNFSHDEFSLWVLVLQLAALVNFLNFGVQIAIGRYVAHWLSLGKQHDAEDILTVGLQILSMLALLGAVVLAVTGVLLPLIFTTIKPELIQTARYMLFWIGGALVLNLPGSAFLGVFVGIQRNDVPAIIALISKGGLAIALILVARATHDLRLASVVYFCVSLVGYMLQYVFFKILCPDWKIRLLTNLPVARREVVSYCASLMVWSIATLLINGVSASIVGIYAFKQVAALGVALNFVAFFSGMFRSFQAPILQIFAKINARGETAKLLLLLDVGSYATSVLLLILSCWMILPADLIFRLWVGPQIAKLSVPIFIIITIATAVRNFGSAYATYLLAVGEQRKVYISPFMEALSNFTVSIFLVAHYGAIGIAWGACFGAIVGVSANFVYNFKHTMPPEFSYWHYFRCSIGDPILSASPMAGVIVLSVWLHLSLLVSVPMMLLATLPSIYSSLRAYRDARQQIA